MQSMHGLMTMLEWVPLLASKTTQLYMKTDVVGAKWNYIKIVKDA